MLQDISQILQSPPTRDFKKEQEIDKAVADVSKMFTRSIFKSLFEEDEKSSLFGETHAGENWKYLFLNTMSDACSGRMGFEDQIKKSITKNPYQKMQIQKGEMIHEIS
ncbi:MAG: hypothetical protein NEHIOOID_00873 [Holosporales bacterium]